MGRITKLQNDIGGLQSVLAEKNKLISGFKAEVETLTKNCEGAIAALKDAQRVAAEAEKVIKALKIA